MAGLYGTPETLPTTKKGIPNAGQFGWTAVEYEEYKQLSQYVDEVKQLVAEANSLLDKIPEATEEIKKIYQDVLEIYDEFLDFVGDYHEIVDEFSRMYREVVMKHADIVIKYDDIVVRHADIIALTTRAEDAAKAAEASAESAGLSESGAHLASFRAQEAADNAKVSEDNALDSYNKSYDLYLELQKGMIYRGAWNPNSGSYPDNKGTNSTWDVILNAGQDSVDFDGKKWFFGDRLIYVLDGNQWYQVEAGTVVKSINGKVGSVVLTAVDVDALPITGGILTGNLGVNGNISSNGSVVIESSASNIMIGDIGRDLSFKTKSTTLHLNIGANKERIFHTADLPTKEDVGLGNLNNWEATSDLDDDSAFKYSTALAANTLNKRIQSAENLAFVYALIL